MPSLNTKLATAPNATSNYVLRATSSTTIGNSTIQDDGTNVAIGTTPGTYKLNVSGTLNATGAATFSSSVTATQLNATTTAAGYASILTNTNGASDSNGLLVKAGSTASEYVVRFAPQSDASTFFTVKGNGNVGIGTSSPESVTNFSTLQIDGTSGSMVRTGTSNYGGYFATIPTADALVISNVRNPINGNFSNTGKAATAISLYSESGNGYITFGTSSTNNTGQTERLRIQADGILKLSTTTSITSDNNTILSYSPNGYLYIQGGSTGLGLAGSGNRNNAIYINSTSNQIQFHTSDGTSKAVITSGGNFAISGAVYRYNGTTVVGGSFTNLTSIDMSSSRTYLIQMIATNVEATLGYRIFGVLQGNATSSTYTFVSLASQTMDVQFSGTTVQARTTNGQQWTFNWSITQLL